MVVSCPPREALVEFAVGKLTSRDLEKVSAHVDECTVCQQTLSEITATNDSLVGKVQQAGASDAPTGPAAQARAKSEKSAAERTTASPKWSQFEAALLELNLATSDEIAALAKQIGGIERDDAVERAVRDLASRGKLTKFQAQVVFQGKAAGLVYGDYVIQDKLGAGGMGQVYLAVHRKMRRQVALKVMSSAALKSPESVRRFEREVVAAAKLIHPNIVTAFDAGQQRGAWYLVMEYVAANDLSKRLKENGPLPVAEAVGFIAQAARGLAFAHGRGVVHRDIKPGNLLVDAEGTVKILDMGLARFDDGTAGNAPSEEGELTQSGQVMGTADYMAPEQAVDTSKAEAKADVYSLGCSLYRLLTGKAVYAGNTFVEKILAHREQPIPSICALRPEAPPALDELFMRMVAKRAEDRPTAAEAVNMLETVLTAPVMPAVTIGPHKAATGGRGPASSAAVPATRVGSAPLAPAQAEGPGVKGKPSPRAKPQSQATGVRGQGSGKKPPTKWIAAGAAGFVLVCLGIWLIVRDEDGNETARVQIPAGGSTTILAPGEPPGAGPTSLPASKPTPSASPTFFPTPKPNAPGGLPGAKTPNPPPMFTTPPLAVASATPATPKPTTPPSVPTIQPVGPEPPRAVAPFDAAQARAHQEAWAKLLGTTVETTNSVGMKMVLIPPGEFLMGSTDEQVEAALKVADEIKADDPNTKIRIQSAERPQHKVVLTKPFFMCATEVTVGQFKKFAEATGYQADARTTAAADDNLPATFINWHDATAYCAWLSQADGFAVGEPTTSRRLGKRYRLPTEAEWEYACRAGTTTQYSFGDHHAPLDQYGWHKGNAGGESHPVGTKLPNAFGLFDLHGNLYEWCGDLYGEKWYSQSPSNDPINLSAGSSGPNRVIRGGSRLNIASYFRSTYRHNSYSLGLRNSHYGFRCVSEWEVPAVATSAVSPPPVAQPMPIVQPTGPEPPRAVAPFDAAQARAHQEAWAKHLGTTVETTNSVGMKMVLIPPGEFMMGSTDEQVAEAMRVGNSLETTNQYTIGRLRKLEHTPHKVVVTQPYFMSSRESTVAQFRLFVESTKYVNESKSDWRNPGYVTADELPVSQITWNDAKAFCEWLSKRENAQYRLPTEAEWECACRAGTLTLYSFGNDPAQLTQYACYDANAKEAPNAVGSKLPNAYGLYDMQGNVQEWCNDLWAASWSGPAITLDPIGPLTGPAHAIRGGGWTNGPSLCTSTFRIDRGTSSPFNNIGFRVVRTSLESPPPVVPTKPITTAKESATSAPPRAVAPFDAKQARAHQEAWAKYLGTTVETTNSVGMKMVLLPPGEFQMGSTDVKAKAELPQHRVVLTRPLLIGATEVTMGQFKRFRASGIEYIKYADDFPVSRIIWADAVAFCNWLSEQERRPPCYRQEGDAWEPVPTGTGYRLPTEAEWEYACRAGTTTQYSYGDDASRLSEYAWHNKNTDGKPNPVGTKLPNPFGLYDMHGNVREWCQDFYDEAWYAASPLNDPTGPATGIPRVTRGGSWYHIPSDWRSGSRYPYSPTYPNAPNGFRIVRVLDAPTTTAVGPPSPGTPSTPTK